jgi:glutamyl-tRNA(Gln) amidotransferase subunit D
MYAAELRKALDKAGAKEGERLTLEKDGKSYEGVLMPRSEFGDAHCIILKQDNGYNIGIRFDAKTSLKKAGKKVVAEKLIYAKLEQNKKLPQISLLSTGGTIACKVDYETGGVAPALNAEEILHAVPELLSWVYIRDFKQLSQIASEDLLPENWKNMAESIAKELNSGLEGVVVTHGTDTMHFSTAAMAFMLRGLNKPVVFVGSQRSSDRGSSDAAMNLICGSYVAGYSDIAEVGICMHASSSDNICFFSRGTKVRKMHTSRRDTFRPINEPPLAKVWPFGRMEIVNKNYRKKFEGEVTADTKFEEKVALVKSYPGSDPDYIRWLVERKNRGIVVEATGLGHVPTQPMDKSKSWLPAIKEAIDKGVTVAFAPQTIYGRLHPLVYANLRKMYEAGVVYCEDMLPETAYVKLGWVLGHEKDPQKVKELMLTNVAGEISPRTLPEAFLY